jgi:rhomboid protease GluP
MAGKAAAFGKRGLAAPAPTRFPARRATDHIPPNKPIATPVPAPETDIDTMDAFHAAGIPLFAAGLIFLLCVVFAIEVRDGADLAGALTPTVDSLKAMGGVSGKLVLEDGQWWRLLTAPLLHGGLSHLIGNCVALALTGFYLERLIGGPWFLALFVLAGIGGSAGSLAQNDPRIVSVGASGAIMGVMALAFLVADRAPDAKRARRMRVRSLFFGVPAILPAFLGTGTDHVDYGAHIGGFLTGGVVWLLLGLLWPRNQARPSGSGLATLLALSGGGAALVAFGLAVARPVPVTVATDSPLIPSAQLPHSTGDSLARSAELVEHWPADPRARYMRAMYFLEKRDLADASEQLRSGIALMPRFKDELQPELGYRLAMTLALIVRQQGDMDAARKLAAEGCAAPQARDWDLREELTRRHVCQ